MQRPALFTIPMAKEANVEARINRILDSSRALPKSFGGGAWLALFAVAAPSIYFVAAIQLAPAQTMLAIPAPNPPEAPVLVAQAASPPAAQVPQPPPGTQVPTNRLRDAQQTLLQQMGAYVIPDGLWLSDNLFSGDRDKARQIPETPSQGDPDTRISLSVADTRDVRLSIPLGDSIEHHVMLEISDQDGHLVRAGEHRVVGLRWDLTVSLTPGSYHLRAVIKKAADGSMVARGFDFDVN